MKNLVLFSIFLFAFSQTGFAELIGRNGMLALANRAATTLEDPSQDNTFYLEDESKKRHKSGSAAMIFPQDIEEMAAILAKPSSWCELLTLHLNVKACTFDLKTSELVIYLGRKFYQPPEEAYKIVYKFKTIKEDAYFAVSMSARKGPIGTSDFQFDFEILRLNGRSFSRIYLSNRQSWISSFVANIYLSTAAKTKDGISTIGRNDDGSPNFTKGETASFERNILRYYFAISAFLQNIHILNDKERHVSQLKSWFMQTEKYTQLYEMEREEYVAIKTKERLNQTRLQNATYQPAPAAKKMKQH